MSRSTEERDSANSCGRGRAPAPNGSRRALRLRRGPYIGWTAREGVAGRHRFTLHWDGIPFTHGKGRPMKKHASILSIVVLGLAACGDGGTDVDPATVPASIAKVRGDGQTAGSGEELPIAPIVRVRNADGDPISGATVTFTVAAGGGSVDPASVETDSDGEASATWTLGPTVGEHILTAAADTVSTDFSAFVIAGDCDNRTEIDLAAGEVSVMDPPSPEDCLFLPSGESGDRYRIAILHASASENESNVPTARFVIVGSGVEPAPPVSAAASPSMSPKIRRIDDPTFAEALMVKRMTDRHHTMLRERERELLERIGTVNPPPRYGGSAGPLRGPARAPGKRRFDVTTSCSTQGTLVTGLLLGEDDNLAIYQDSSQSESDPVDETAVQMMLDYYADHGRPIIRDYFGGVSDINGDGQVVVLITPVVQGDVAAFVWAGDLYSESDCTYSNRMELVYFSRTDRQQYRRRGQTTSGSERSCTRSSTSVPSTTGTGPGRLSSVMDRGGRVPKLQRRCPLGLLGPPSAGGRQTWGPRSLPTTFYDESDNSCGLGGEL